MHRKAGCLIESIRIADTNRCDYELAKAHLQQVAKHPCCCHLCASSRAPAYTLPLMETQKDMEVVNRELYGSMPFP